MTVITRIHLTLTISLFSLLFFSSYTFTVIAAAPDTFSHETVASGFARTTAVAFLPDGRILVAEKTGEVKIVDSGNVLPTPLIDLPNVNSHGDRGLLGLAVDPNFEDNGYIYLAYTYENNPDDSTGPKTGQVIRLTVSGNTADYDSRVVLLGSVVGSPSEPSCDFFPVDADCIPSDSASHSVGALRFSPEGYLFIETGDGAGFFEVEEQALRALNLDSLAGKLLRVDTNGEAVTNNPFYTGDAKDNRSKVFAYGIRNSFKYNIRPSNGSVYLGDVGWDTWEEINVASGGENFGWPCREGFEIQSRYQCETENYTDPIYVYPHAIGQSSAVVGGAFAGAYYPEEYRDNYFFADVVEGTIRRMVLDEADEPIAIEEDFLPGADGPVEFITGPDGAVYYLSIFTGELRKIAYTPDETTVPTPPREPSHAGWFDFTIDGQTVVFDASLSTGQIARYSWDFGDGTTGDGEITEHIYDVNERVTVFLYTYDTKGNEHVSSRSVSLSDSPSPIPEPEPEPGPSDAIEGWFDFNISDTKVTFDAGPSSGPIQRFEWNFGDGTNGSGEIADHTYAESGSYIVYLYSYDASGSRHIASRSVLVQGVSDPEPEPEPEPTPGTPAPEFVSATFLSSETIVGETMTVKLETRNTGSDEPYLTTVEFYNEQAEFAGGSSIVNSGVASGDIEELTFQWTPDAPGNYLMQFGYFSPDWTTEYSWEKDIVVPPVSVEHGVPIDADPTHVVSVHDGGERPVFARPVTISSTVRNDGYESPFIAGIEIYDANGDYVYANYSEQVSVKNGETIVFDNEWFPNKAGVFTVHMGIFSPHWAKLYEWTPDVLTIEVYDRTPTE